ncbi:MAG: TAXI family TRAP transporter solute-binding subunit [Magnetovibrionaceae bacterium]
MSATPASAVRQEAWKIALLFSGLLVVAFAFAFQFVEPAPPKTISITTGGEGGLYARYGADYGAAFAAEGITATIQPSAGTAENLARLRDGEADIGFVQSGVGSPEAFPNLISLGRLYLEPLWVFLGPTLDPEAVTRLSDLSGLRLAVGAEGSGTRSVVLPLLEASGVTAETADLLPLSSAGALEPFSNGEVDAVFLVTGPGSDNLRALFAVDGARLMDFARADAISRHWRPLEPITVPQGALDLARDWPEQDVRLLAPSATLVARADLHPAVQTLAAQFATRIHGPGGILENPGAFPNGEAVEFPMSEEAERYYKSGAPFLQRYLPFWAAVWVDRLKVLIVPLIGLMLPLMRVLPPVWRWRIRSRIYRLYRDLFDIERCLVSTPDDLATIRAALGRLDGLEAEIRSLKVPLSYADEAYALRVHVDLVRGKLQGRLAISS